VDDEAIITAQRRGGRGAPERAQGLSALGALTILAVVSTGCLATGGRRLEEEEEERIPAPAPPKKSDLLPVYPPADPCADFASYACGPEEQPGWQGGHSEDVWARRGPALVRFLDELAAGEHLDGSPGTVALRDFYARCEDPAKRGPGLEELSAELAAVTGIRNRDELARALGEWRRQGVSILVGLSPAWDTRDAARIVAARIGLRGPHLPQSFYLQDHRLIAEYERHWSALAKLAGVISPAEVEAAVRIEHWLADKVPKDGADKTREEDRDEDKDAPAPTIGTDELGHRRFRWPAYLRGLRMAAAARFRPVREGSLDAIDALMDIPLSDLKAYMRVVLVENRSEYVTSAFLAEEQRFHQEIVERRRPGPLRLKGACLMLANRAFGSQLASAYLPDLAEPREADAARRLFEALRTRFAALIGGADWIDERSRGVAAAKLQRVGLRLIGDVKAASLDALDLPAGSFLDAHRRVLAWRSAAALDQIGTPYREQPLVPSLETACYAPVLNTVWLSPEIVRPPYLRIDGFYAASFGALGTVIGHELGHALSPALNQLDVANAEGQVWAQQATAAFQERVGCLERQSDALAAAEKRTADGRLTASETLADLTGIKLALSTMESQPQMRGVPPQAAWRRDFFVAYAQQACTFEPRWRSEVDSLRDPHPPARTRINKSMANTPEFASAFACPLGAPLAPRQRCVVW
jgi:putative endopeptidase